MDPKIWGPGLWRYLHTAAANANTKEKRDAFVKLVQALGPTIPCNNCMKHFFDHSRKVDIRNYLQSAQHLFAWTWIMHDAVNHLQKKKWPQRITHAEAIRMYFDVDKDQTIPSNIGLDSNACDEICHGHLAEMIDEDVIDASSQNRQEISETQENGKKFNQNDQKSNSKLESKKIVKRKPNPVKRR
tara:strand:- start:4987 stop:5544 length:558 start_codon:yes stop_codon:yes gene_type:complete